MTKIIGISSKSYEDYLLIIASLTNEQMSSVGGEFDGTIIDR